MLITIAAQPRSPDWAFPKQAGCQATIELAAVTLSHVHHGVILDDTVIATVEVTLAAGGQGAKIEDPHCHSTQAHLVPDAEANTNVRSGRGDQEQGL